MFWPGATRTLVVAGIVLLATGSAGTARATELTYQGQLKLDGVWVTDACDMTFALYESQDDQDVEIGSNVFDGGPLAPPIQVTDGIFTAALDFGKNVYAGDAPLLLEISVRCPSGSNNPYVTLAPWQRLTPAPRAQYAQTAGSVPGLDGHSLDGADGTAVDALFVDSVGSVGIGTTSPGAKMTLSRPTEAGAFQLELRNVGSITSPNYDGIVFTQGANGDAELGSMKLHYRNNGRPDVSLSVRERPDALFVHGNYNGHGGNVGIGTTDPAAKLHVNGDIKTEGQVIIPPTTRYLMVSSSEFVPQRSSMSMYRSFSSLSSLFAPAGQSTTLLAPVHLPDGATITELRALLTDNVPGSDVFVSLEAENQGGGLYFLGVIYTEGTPGRIDAVDESIEDGEIDNSTRSYYLRAVYTVPPDDGEQHFGISAVHIAYEITSLLP